MSITNSNDTPHEALMRRLVRKYRDNAEKYVAPQVLPFHPVESEEFKWPYVDPEHLLQTVETRRGDSGPYSRSTLEVDWEDDSTVEHGHEQEVSEKVRNRYSSWFDAKAVQAEVCMGIVRRSLEKEVADLLMNETTFSGQVTTVDAGDGEKWDHAEGNPIGDVITAKETIYENTGMEADSIVMSRTVYAELQRSASIRKWYFGENAGVGAGAIPDEAIRRALGVDNLFVGRGRERTSNKGVTLATGELWDSDYALVFKVSDGALTGDDEVGLGRIALWTEDSPVPFVYEEYWEDAIRGWVVRWRQNVKAFLMNKAVGHLLKNVT